MSRRTEFSRKTKLAAWEASGGRCADCDRKIFTGDGPEYDHQIPCEMGGDNSPDNCAVLCIPCHKSKTATVDMPTIVKARRVHSKHVNATKPKSTFPGSRNSKWKKKVGGGVERRP